VAVGQRQRRRRAKKARRHQGRHRSRDALDYLRGVLEIVKAAGYKGLVVVIDEAETILRMRMATRGTSRSTASARSRRRRRYPGLLVAVHRDARVLRHRRGVAGLAPLHDRIRFMEQGGFASLRQPQLELKPFDASGCGGGPAPARAVPGDRPAAPRPRDQTTSSSTAWWPGHDRLPGDVGVVPRQFLREFVHAARPGRGARRLRPDDGAYGFEPAELRRTRSKHARGSPARRPPDPERRRRARAHEDVW
jgi:hypothetical protein